MVNLIFGVPWWIYLAITLAGVGAFWVGDKRSIAPLRSTGGIVALLGVLIVVASFFVETDKQKCLRQSKEIAHDVQTQNWSKVNLLLDPHVSMRIPTGTLFVNRDDLLKGIQDAVQQYGLKDVTVLSTTVEQTQTIITVDMNVLSNQNATMGQEVNSSWELQWQKDQGRWELYQITCLQIGDMNLNTMRGMFPR